MTRYSWLAIVAFLAVVLPACKTRSAEELYQAGESALDAGNQEKAVELLEAALKKNRNHEKANYRLARIYMKQEKDELAVPLLERAVQADPGQVRNVFRLGEAYLGINDNERAVSTLKQAVRIDPTHGGANAKLAQGLKRLGRDAEARNVLREALRRVPPSDPYYEVIAREAQSE